MRFSLAIRVTANPVLLACFFFQAEDGIRAFHVTGVQTCALPIFVILKTGPTPMPKGEARDAMFRGHFANMQRLADEGKLVVAGPLDGVEGRRGIFILDAADLDEARALVATDPVIAHGEMVAELHAWYGSAALRQVNATHARIARRSP